MTLVFTVCSNNYLAQALELGKTLLTHNTLYEFKIGLVDKKSDLIDYSQIPYEIILVEDLKIQEFDDMFMRYDIVELNTSVKPFYFLNFFKKNKWENIIYMDPDIQVFSNLVELENELTNNDIVITPHFFSPINDDKWQAEEDFLNSGLYNLGFIAIKQSVNSFKMLEWWADRLKTKAYIDFKRGMFTDQIWINFVPIFFYKVSVFKHLGYNVAYWNLHERIITLKDNQYYINENIPLVFYHYASFRPLNPNLISSGQRRYTFENRPDIVPLFTKYTEILLNNNYTNYNKLTCFYYKKKTDIEFKIYREKVKNYPLYKKVLGKFVRVLISRINLVLDYQKL
jgi:hypothetical protein